MSKPKTIKINIMDMRGIRSFCMKTNKILDEEKYTVDGRLIYTENGRVYYADNNKDIWKEHYDVNSISTSYRSEGGVNHLTHPRRR